MALLFALSDDSSVDTTEIPEASPPAGSSASVAGAPVMIPLLDASNAYHACWLISCGTACSASALVAASPTISVWGTACSACTTT